MIFSFVTLLFFSLYLTRFAQFQPGTISYMFCCFSCTKECHQLKSNETNEQTYKNQLQISKYTDAFSFIWYRERKQLEKSIDEIWVEMIVVLLLLTLRRVYCCFSCQLSISVAIRLSLFCFNFSFVSFIFF